jgi:hypothetical protein
MDKVNRERIMWPFKNKIKEHPKSRLYGNRSNNQNYSTWDHLSIVEKFCMILMPIGLTFIDCMMLEAIFGLGTWFNIIVSTLSTILFMVLMWWFAEWMAGE